jgi:hypothetical protein
MSAGPVRGTNKKNQKSRLAAKKWKESLFTMARVAAWKEVAMGGVIGLSWRQGLNFCRFGKLHPG